MSRWYIHSNMLVTCVNISRLDILGRCALNVNNSNHRTYITSQRCPRQADGEDGSVILICGTINRTAGRGDGRISFRFEFTCDEIRCTKYNNSELFNSASVFLVTVLTPSHVFYPWYSVFLFSAHLWNASYICCFLDLGCISPWCDLSHCLRRYFRRFASSRVTVRNNNCHRKFQNSKFEQFTQPQRIENMISKKNTRQNLWVRPRQQWRQPSIDKAKQMLRTRGLTCFGTENKSEKVDCFSQHFRRRKGPSVRRQEDN